MSLGFDFRRSAIVVWVASVATALASLILAMTACGFTVVGSNEGIANGSLPPGQDGDGGGGAGDALAAAGDANAPPLDDVPIDSVAACGRPSTYVDDFASATVGPDWNSRLGTGASLAVRDRQLVMSAPPAGRATLESKLAVNLRGDRLRVRLAGVTMPKDDGDGAIVFAARFDDKNEIAFAVVRGDLRLRSVVAGTVSEMLVPYDPIVDRWLQIVENGQGSLTWQTSPNASAGSWTTKRTLDTPTPSFARAVKIVFEVAGSSGGSTSTSSPIEARFERLNAGRPRAPWCKAATLVDDFADSIVSTTLWSQPIIQQGACTWSESGSQARFVMTGAGACLCAYRSATAFDLRESAVVLEVPIITNYHPQVGYFLRLEDVEDRFAEIGFVGTNELFENASGLAAMKTPYGGNNDTFWRLREAAGILYWESSRDGTTYVTKRSAPAPFSLDRLRVTFGARTDAAMPSSISIGASGLN